MYVCVCERETGLFSSGDQPAMESSVHTWQCDLDLGVELQNESMRIETFRCKNQAVSQTRA